MSIEIEHKYLVVSDVYRQMSKGSCRIRQGYLCREPERTVRVRVKDEKAYLTVKGITRGDKRAEFEYEIPYSDVEEMLRLCVGGIIDKTRYYVEFGGNLWEVDEFHGGHEGLVVAEIELPVSTHDYLLPFFVGEEVTGNPAYYNSNL